MTVRKYWQRRDNDNRPRPKWHPITPQKKQGLITRYVRSRVMMSHHHELRGDNRLYLWVVGLKPFLSGGRPLTEKLPLR